MKKIERLIYWMAWRFAIPGHPLYELDDLVQEGWLVYERAKNQFDEKRGVKFSTYLYWQLRGVFSNMIAKSARRQTIDMANLAAADRVCHPATINDMMLSLSQPAAVVVRQAVDIVLDDGLCINTASEIQKEIHNRTKMPYRQIRSAWREIKRELRALRRTKQKWATGQTEMELS